ncbi:MAG: ABC transporter permease [Chloroflexi bacterium]|nr:ABC transporter permease [Chloroflexota bacterium]
MSRRRDPLLRIGLVLVAGFLLLGFVGPSLAPHDPLKVFDKVMYLDGEMVVPARQPVAPGRLPGLFPLGTDEAGRDILSRLLCAIRPTLLLCSIAVAIRAVLGIAFGLAAGWLGGLPRQMIDLAISAALAVPALVFCVAAISFMGAHRGLAAFLIALALTGWADVAAFVRNQTLSTLQSPFIESARAVGVRPRSILWRHVLPQLWPALPALISFEIGTVLLIVSELGFLGVYIGGGTIYEVARGDNPDTWKMLTAGYPELGQMLSGVWAKVIMVPWEPIIVGIVVFAMIFAFNLLGEGLRRQMDITRRHEAR